MYFLLFKYWCAYGPIDSQNESITPQARRRRKSKQFNNGCQCHFIVSQLYLFPWVACICYPQYQHVDLHGDICHGLHYTDTDCAKFSFAPWLSNDMKSWICDMLHKGFTPQQVLQQHIDLVQSDVKDSKSRPTRDTFLTIRDILNVSCEKK